MKEIKIKLLDCTLRDGGFYNNWDFDEELIKKYLKIVSKSGVDIVEIGYRSILSDEFYGLMKYSDDYHLSFLKEYNNVEFAIMVDLKEFIQNKYFDEQLFKKTFQKTSYSNITWVRLAILSGLAEHTNTALDILKELGYKTTVNLMQMSLLKFQQIADVVRIFKSKTLDVFYFADSFGSMYPENIKDYVKLIRDNFDGEIGIHTHDNLSLAYANTVEAMNYGVEYVDSTILGMGRGAGNLKTESILLDLQIKTKDEKYNPNILLDFIDNELIPLKERYNWGTNFNYVLAGLKNIHPMYCQKLEELGRYTSDKFIQILEQIPSQNRAKYTKEELDKAITKAHENCVAGVIPQSDDIYTEFNSLLQLEELIVIATGPSTQKYHKYIQEYIDTYLPFVIECNINPLINYKNGFATLIHERHLQESKLHKNVVFGNYNTYQMVNSVLNKFFFQYHLRSNKFEVEKDNITIPFEVVSMYALGLALLLRPKKIYLTGFDGYKDTLNNSADYIKQQEMNEFILLFNKKAKELNIEVCSVTPTTYQISRTSIYYLLRSRAMNS